MTLVAASAETVMRPRPPLPLSWGAPRSSPLTATRSPGPGSGDPPFIPRAMPKAATRIRSGATLLTS